MMEHFPNAVALSALTGEGIGDLLIALKNTLYESFITVKVRLPYKQGQLIALFHEVGQVDRLEHGRKGVLIQGRIPGRLLAQYKPWAAKPGDTETDEE
jgi:GTP-binding protein HflX